jgi:hypothetical protein
MSDVGGGNAVSGVNLTFEDGFPSLPDETPIFIGTYRPSNEGSGDTFPAGAPAGPYGATLAGLDASSPNGTWKLYVADDAPGDTGSIGSWSLTLQTATSACCNQTCSLGCPAPIVTSQAVVNFPFPQVTGTCGPVGCTPPSGSTFPLGTTTVTCTPDGSFVPVSCSFPVTVRGADFFTLTPCRLVDTRLSSPLQSGVVRTFTVHGQCGIPPSALAVALNVAVTQPSNGGFVTLFPDAGAVPGTSTLNFGGGQTRADNAVLSLATDGSGTLSVRPVLLAGGTVHLILDVTGYFQ